MKLIVGLGNPGKEYSGARHNAGFQCVDLLREKLGFPEFKMKGKFSAAVSEGIFNGRKLVMAKPQTFMNASGEAVSKLFNFYDCGAENLILIYDDVDLELGRIRVRDAGSAGSHNGMKSVIDCLGFSNFPRIRIGIESRGVSAPEKQDITSFVLHPFSKKELSEVKKSLENAAEAALLLLK